MKNYIEEFLKDNDIKLGESLKGGGYEQSMVIVCS